MPNIFHAQDAEMFGRQQVAKWQAEFDAKWNEPETVMIDAMWAQIPDPIKEQMRTMMDPELLAIVEGGNYGNKLAK